MDQSTVSIEWRQGPHLFSIIVSLAPRTVTGIWTFNICSVNCQCGRRGTVFCRRHHSKTVVIHSLYEFFWFLYYILITVIDAVSNLHSHMWNEIQPAYWNYGPITKYLSQFFHVMSPIKTGIVHWNKQAVRGFWYRGSSRGISCNPFIAYYWGSCVF